MLLSHMNSVMFIMNFTMKEHAPGNRFRRHETGARAWTGLDDQTMEKRERGKGKIEERLEGFGGKGARERMPQGERVPRGGGEGGEGVKRPHLG